MIRTYLQWGLVLAATLFLFACASTGGQVVQVQKDTGEVEQMLAEEDAKQVEAFREKTQDVTEQPPELRQAVQEAKHMDVSDYMAGKSGELAGDEYYVGGDDILSVTVFEDAELNVEEVRVTNDGTINMPLLGQLQVAGKTTSAIEDQIAQGLIEENYLINPHVSVQVVEYNSHEVLVLGAVEKSGPYTLQKAESVLGVLSKAGGVDMEKAGQEIVVVRTETWQGQKQKLAIHINLRDLLSQERTTNNLRVQDKDTVYVPKAKKFFVIGQVNEPGGYVLRDETSVVEAVSMAGGFTRIAARNRVKISRVVDGEKQVLIVNVEQLTEQGGTAEANVLIRPGDVVIVPESYF